MRKRALGVALAFAVLLSGASVVRLTADETSPKPTEQAVGEKLASGLDLGQTLPAFNPVHVTGPDRGTNTCPV